MSAETVDSQFAGVGAGAAGGVAGQAGGGVGVAPGTGRAGAGQDFILPDLGEGLTEAEIVSWRVAVGDTVSIDQPIVEVESAKSVVDLPCPYAGVIVALHAQAGETVHAGQPLVTVAPEGAAIAGDEAEAPAAQSAGGTGASSGGSEAPAAQSAGGQPASGDGAADQKPVAGAEAGASSSASAALSDDSGEDSGAVLIGYGTTKTPAVKRAGRRSFGKLSLVADTQATAAPSETSAQDSGTQGSGSRTRSGAGAEPASQTQPAAATEVADTSAAESSSVSPVVSPLVRKLAADNGFAAKELAGTGPGGLVMRRDVMDEIARRGGLTADAPQAASAQTQAGNAQPAGSPQLGDQARAALGADSQAAGGAASGNTAHAGTTPASTEFAQVIPVTGLRKVVSERMSRSRQEVPEATIWLDVDVTELLAFKAQLEQAHGERFSLMSLVARFVTAGLQRYPILNSSLDEAGENIQVHSQVNLGIAADTPRGLMVPVVHGAGGMTLRELNRELRATVEKAGTGRFEPGELTGGTFTLNNYGVLGVDGSAPIINQPEVAMLGMGRIKDRPWVVDGELCVRKVMYLSFVFDHRVCDGREPSEFVTFVAGCIENPVSVFADL